MDHRESTDGSGPRSEAVMPNGSPWLRRVLPWPATFVAILVGTALRAWHFGAGRALWIDEAMLALNVMDRGWVGLAGPLELRQAAPLLFLWGSKAAGAAGGYHEWALRAIPFAGSILALVVVALVARRLLTPWATFAAVAALAAAPSAIYFAGEFKQYSTDGLASAIVLALALRLRDARSPPPVWLVLSGVALLLASHTAVLLLAGLGLTGLIGALAARSRRAIVAWVVVGLVWVSVFAVGYELTALGTENMRYLTGYWAGAFIPFPPRSASDVATSIQIALDALASVWGSPFDTWNAGMRVSLLATGLAAIGAVVLWTTARPAGAVIIVTVLCTLLAAAAGRYPLEGRLTFYLLPCLVLCVGAGVDALSRVHRLGGVVLSGTLLGMLLLADLAAVRHGAVREESARVLASLHDQLRAGDHVHLASGAWPAALYYARLRGPGLWRNVPVTGEPRPRVPGDQSDPVLGPLRGRARVWFISSHPRMVAGRPDVEQIEEWLARYGRPVTRIEATGAYATLYDLRTTP